MSTPQTPPPRRNKELLAFAVAAAVVVAILIGFFTYDDGNETAPSVGGNSEEPATAAPLGVEPPEPNTR